MAHFACPNRFGLGFWLRHRFGLGFWLRHRFGLGFWLRHRFGLGFWLRHRFGSRRWFRFAFRRLRRELLDQLLASIAELQEFDAHAGRLVVRAVFDLTHPNDASNTIDAVVVLKPDQRAAHQGDRGPDEGSTVRHVSRVGVLEVRLRSALDLRLKRRV
jgi:hypothetical protein